MARYEKDLIAGEAIKAGIAYESAPLHCPDCGHTESQAYLYGEGAFYVVWCPCGTVYVISEKNGAMHRDAVYSFYTGRRIRE